MPEADVWYVGATCHFVRGTCHPKENDMAVCEVMKNTMVGS